MKDQLKMMTQAVSVVEDRMAESEMQYQQQTQQMAQTDQRYEQLSQQNSELQTAYELQQDMLSTTVHKMKVRLLMQPSHLTTAAMLECRLSRPTSSMN